MKMLTLIEKIFLFLVIFSTSPIFSEQAADKKSLSFTNELDKIIIPQIEENVSPNDINETQSLCKTHPTKKKKLWTIITYMAADNDLAPFARKNLNQQADIGSNQYINIVTQLDTRVAGNQKVTKRYYVKKNKLIITNQNDPNSQRMDSGSPKTLIDCCKWAITNFPAENYVLILWNHGTGALDVGPKRTINPSPLFMFNPESNLIELDRSIPFFDFVQATLNIDERGICFDDSTGHYLSNHDIDTALNTVCNTLLNGKKFNIICFDACLMSMIEIASITKKYAEYMTASQEVELGTGYDYRTILMPFLTKPLSQEHFIKHIVAAYGKAYSNITNDYTQSAIKLSVINFLEENIDQVAVLLIKSLQQQKGTTVTDAIKTSRHKLFCTHFDEPSYIDLHHFYGNLRSNIKRFIFENKSEEKKTIEKLDALLAKGQELINSAVVANIAGKNLAKAKGLSIYFPERRMHSTYTRTSFAQSNQWSSFIKLYLSSGKNHHRS